MIHQNNEVYIVLSMDNTMISLDTEVYIGQAMKNTDSPGHGGLYGPDFGEYYDSQG